MADPTLKFAISHYDRFVPLFDGTARANGFNLDVLHVGQSNPGAHGIRRHARMFAGEFDVAELSLSSYLMARARGLPFTAIPVFPRRLFSQSQIWVNAERGIRQPKDLFGKRVALGTFQTTLSVLAKGDLQSEYGVPWREIEWFVSDDETIPFKAADGVIIRKIPDGKNMGEMLQAGEVEAIFRPHPPRQALEGASNIRRLFDDPKAEETRYFRKNGFYPIMHLVAFRDDILSKHPDAAVAMLDLFQRMNEMTLRYYDDPNWSRLVWGRLHLEEERKLLARDLWPTGVSKNHANLTRFMEYSHDQGLISKPMSVESLFATSTLGS